MSLNPKRQAPDPGLAKRPRAGTFNIKITDVAFSIDCMQHALGSSAKINLKHTTTGLHVVLRPLS